MANLNLICYKKSFEKLLVLSDSKLETIFIPLNTVSKEAERWQELEHLMPEIIKRLNRKHANAQFVCNRVNVLQKIISYARWRN